MANLHANRGPVSIFARGRPILQSPDGVFILAPRNADKSSLPFTGRTVGPASCQFSGARHSLAVADTIDNRQRRPQAVLPNVSTRDGGGRLGSRERAYAAMQRLVDLPMTAPSVIPT